MKTVLSPQSKKKDSCRETNSQNIKFLPTRIQVSKEELSSLLAANKSVSSKRSVV